MSAYRITYANGQDFDVELPSFEALKWFVSLDYPKAALVGEGTQVTAWEHEEARRSGQKPVAVAAKASFRCETN